MIFKRSNKFPPINLPKEIQGRYGVIAIPSNILGVKGGSFGYSLCVQDSPLNTKDLSRIKDLHLFVKVGVVKTPFGLLVFLLYSFWDVRKPADKFTYEYLINPSDIQSYQDYLLLGMQPEWLVLVIQDNEVLSSTVFNNSYNIEDSIRESILMAVKDPCVDFDAAKAYYFSAYDIESLIE